MLIKIDEFEFTECWDGVLNKKLSDYPKITDWEIQTVLDFIRYESEYGRTCEIEAEDSILHAMNDVFCRLSHAIGINPWWRENGLDRDIDTLWTFDFAEYQIRPGSGYTMEDVWKKTRNPNPERGAALYMPEGRHILLLHGHDETDELVPGYYRLLLDDLLNHGVQFVKPAFV